MLFLWFSVFQFDTTMPSQVKTRRRGMYPDHRCVDITELVPNYDGNDDRNSKFAPKEEEPIDITRNSQVTPTSPMACCLSGKPSRVEMFLKEHPISLWHLGELAQKSNTQPKLIDAFSTVMKGKLINFKQM